MKIYSYCCLRSILLAFGLIALATCFTGAGYYLGKTVQKVAHHSSPLSTNVQPNGIALPLQPLMRAVHYFGHAAPTNFWNAVSLAEVPSDLARIRADGFNTIILVVPWPEFQPKIRTDSPLNDGALSKLTEIIRLAKKADLQVILRLGYAWSYDPQMDVGVLDRIDALYHDEAIYQRWLQHIEAICRQVCQEPNLQFGFLSWEDLYPINITGTDPNRSHPEINQQFRLYLQSRFRLDEISAMMGEKFSSWDQVTIPLRKHPSYHLVMEYWDHALVNRFFIAAQKRFPRLSMEVRLDADPIWNAEGKIDWFSHSSTYKLPNALAVTVHYSVSWGMKNEGDQVSATEALKMFDRALVSVRDQIGATPLFVDQFLFFDNTPMFTRNTQVRATELDDFLVGAAEVLRSRQTSLGLWQYQDYPMSVVYNPSFEVGLYGWAVDTKSPAPKITDQNGSHSLALPAGSAIQQRIDGMNLRQKYPGANDSVPAELCFLAEAASNGELSVQIDEKNQATFPVHGPKQRYCQTIQVPLKFDLSLRNMGNTAISLDQIELFNHVQDSQLYTRDNQPKSALPAIRQLNQKLAL